MTLLMPKIAEIHKIDARNVAESLKDARRKFDGVHGDMVLDLSSVQRIDPAALREMEALARPADESSEPICLLHVNVEIYKVLKLANLATRFNFRH